MAEYVVAPAGSRGSRSGSPPSCQSTVTSNLSVVPGSEIVPVSCMSAPSSVSASSAVNVGSTFPIVIGNESVATPPKPSSAVIWTV